jgi:AcrR family transcriptional regulator
MVHFPCEHSEPWFIFVKVRIDAARNQARILDVARRLVSAQGPDVAMDDIAREAGVAVGTLYRHFPTKAALVEAVVHDSMEQLADAADAAAVRAAEGGDAAAELFDLFRVVARRHTEDAAVKEAAASLGATAPGVDGRFDFEPGSPPARAWAGIVRLLDLAVVAGSVRPDLTPSDLLTFVAGVPRDPASPEQRDRYIEIVIDGMQAGRVSWRSGARGGRRRG